MTFGEAIGRGKPLLELRPRYEFVDQANKPEDASAATIRAAIGWQTQPWHDFSGVVQLLGVTHFDNNFNPDPSVTTSRFPTVADPDTFVVPQLYLDWTGLEKTSVKWGRQFSKLNNLRVVGDVNSGRRRRASKR
jgi:hypothetical protein